MSNSDKNEFLDKYYGIWLAFLAAFPASSARCIELAMSEGQLDIRDMLTCVEDSGTDFRLLFNSVVRGEEKVSYLIDARGAGYSEDALRRLPLICHLLDQGAVSIHPLGGLRINPGSCEVVSVTGETIKGLHIIGDMTKGEFLNITDVGSIVNQSVLLASAIDISLHASSSLNEEVS